MESLNYQSFIYVNTCHIYPCNYLVARLKSKCQPHDKCCLCHFKNVFFTQKIIIKNYPHKIQNFILVDFLFSFSLFSKPGHNFFIHFHHHWRNICSIFIVCKKKIWANNNSGLKAMIFALLTQQSNY